MQKKYVFILFCFLSDNAIAQLSQDLAKFTQTLNNLAAKLPAEVGGPGVITVPASGRITLPDSGEDVEAPPGSTIEVQEVGIIVKIAPMVESTVTLPATGFIEISKQSVVRLPGGIYEFVPAEGASIKVSGGGTVKIKPQKLLPPVKPAMFPLIRDDGTRVDVPDTGIVTLPNDEVINVPVGSKVRIYPEGLYITVPSSGGDVQLPSTGGKIGIADQFNATLQLPNGIILGISSGDFVDAFTSGVVKVIPKKTLPPYVTVFGPKKRTILVPPNGGYIKIWGDESIHVPNDSTIEQGFDGELVITVSNTSDGDITEFSRPRIVGLRRDSSSPVTLQLSDGRAGEIVAGGYIYITPGVIVKIIPK